jgi:hypothetical protein
MFAFTLTVILAIGPSTPVKGVTVQSQAVYLSMEDCQAAMEEMSKIIATGLPLGSRSRIGGSCAAPESIDG